MDEVVARGCFFLLYIKIRVQLRVRSRYIYRICDHFVRIVRVIFLVFILVYSVDVDEEMDEKYKRLFCRLKINCVNY